VHQVFGIFLRQYGQVMCLMRIIVANEALLDRDRDFRHMKGHMQALLALLGCTTPGSHSISVHNMVQVIAKIYGRLCRHGHIARFEELHHALVASMRRTAFYPPPRYQRDAAASHL
jgi:hypothetical protein